MNSASGELTLRDYGQIVVRRRWVVAGAIVAAVVASLVISFLSDSVYESEAQVLITGSNDRSVFGQQAGASANDRERTVRTAVELIEGDELRARVQQALQLDEPPPEVDARSMNEADLVSLAVRSTDPRAAQTVADAYVDQFIASRRDESVRLLSDATDEIEREIAELQERIDGLRPFDERREGLNAQQQTLEQTLSELQTDAALQTGGVSRVANAGYPGNPVAPQPVRNSVLAAAAGLIIGLAAAFVLEHLDDSINSVADLQATSDVPVLAAIPAWTSSDRPIAIEQPFHRASEAFRALRTSVQVLAVDRPTVLQVTSPLPGEGKTVTVCNLAIVLAHAGQRVIIVDADQRVPRVHEIFGVAQSPGLTDFVQGASTDAVIQSVSLDDLHRLDLIASGQLSAHPSESVGGAPVGALLHALAERYDTVLVDSPPVLPVADSVSIARNVDGLLVVTEAGRTKRHHVSAAVAQLAPLAAPVVGVVLNRAPTTAIDDDFDAYGAAAARRRARAV